MEIYSLEEIHKGMGAFTQIMRNQDAMPGTANIMSGGVAIGIIFSMIRSGLPAVKINKLIDTEFAADAPKLKQILKMYEGDSWDIHLWNLLPDGQYKLCTELCRVGRPEWRYNSNEKSADW